MAQRILVVDDDREFRNALVKIFEREGYSVVPAADGDEALNCVRGTSFALIVADARMPKLGGRELVRRLKEQCPGTALIVISALADGQIRADMLENGAFDYVSKPVRRDELLRLARRALAPREH